MGVKGTQKVTLSHWDMLCRRKDAPTKKLLWWHLTAWGEPNGLAGGALSDPLG